MEAPEKLYFPPDDALLGIYNIKDSDEEIEYTRTDVFIEKAVVFLKERIILEDNSWYIEGQVTLKDKMIEDFRKYMKGE